MSQRSVTAADTFIGARLRAARIAARMSQETLVEKLGVSFQQIQKYEKGVNRLSASRLSDIAALFGKPVTWFSGISAMPRARGATSRDLGAELLGTSSGRRLAESFLAIEHPDERAVLVQMAELFARRSAQRQQAAE